MLEICATEKTYLNSLHMLLTLYLRPLTDDYKTGKPVLGGSVLASADESGLPSLDFHIGNKLAPRRFCDF